MTITMRKARYNLLDYGTKPVKPSLKADTTAREAIAALKWPRYSA